MDLGQFNRQRLRSGLALGAAAGALCVATSVSIVGCAEDVVKTPGQLIVSLDTDMALPQQVDAIHVSIDVQGDIKFQATYDVGSGPTVRQIPGTLTIVEEREQSGPVRIRVTGKKGDRWRTFREAITNMPRDRIASLRMPIQWLCDDTVRVVQTQDDSGMTRMEPRSTCGDGNTCKAGRCVPSEVKEPTLDDYAAEDVFGGAAEAEDGTCFDTIPCLVKGQLAVPDAACTIEQPEGDDINVGLRVTNDGICDSSSTVCFVPLDGNSTEGWTKSGGRLTLPSAVCDKLEERVISGVYVSTACETKEVGRPPCGEWTGITKKSGPKPGSASGPDVPAATIVTTLPNTATSKLCCPLMSDGGKLYACACASETAATLFEIDPNRGALPRSVGSVNPPPNRQNKDYFAAAVFGGALYWAANEQIQKTPLAGSDAFADTLPVNGSVYETASVLAGASGVFVLATGLTNAENAPVQLLKLREGADEQRFDTGGNRPVLQFAEDEDEVFLATDFDRPIDGGARFERTTAVIRIDKQTGARELVLPETRIDIEANNVLQGGYIAVAVAGDSLFALFETPPAEDGTVRSQIHRAGLNGSREAEMPFEETIDPRRTQVRLQGAIDGTVILLRVQFDGSAVKGSEVIGVPAEGGEPQLISTFAREFPITGLASDAERVYWLNNSGRLYGLPRSALQ